MHCSLVVTCWERVDVLTRLYLKFSLKCFVTFPCCVLDQVWCLIVLIPDICLLTYVESLASTFGSKTLRIYYIYATCYWYDYARLSLSIELFIISLRSKEESKDKNRFNQVPRLIETSNGKVTKTQEHITYKRAWRSAFSQ